MRYICKLFLLSCFLSLISLNGKEVCGRDNGNNEINNFKNELNELQEQVKDFKNKILSLINEIDNLKYQNNVLLSQIEKPLHVVVYNKNKDILEEVIFENEYNLLSCVGNGECKFKVNAHIQLYLDLCKKSLDEDLRLFLKDLIYKIELYNVKAGSALGATKENVKLMSTDLPVKLKNLKGQINLDD